MINYIPKHKYDKAFCKKLDELQRISTNPTEDDMEEELDEIAQEILLSCPK